MKKEESMDTDYMLAILHETADLLIEFLSINSCSYAFNDLVFIIVTNLKKCSKNYKVIIHTIIYIFYISIFIFLISISIINYKLIITFFLE